MDWQRRGDPLAFVVIAVVLIVAGIALGFPLA
jgi:hypothetical protein